MPPLPDAFELPAPGWFSERNDLPATPRRQDFVLRRSKLERMRSRWITLSLGLLVATLGAVACSEEGDPPVTPYQEFVGEYSNAFCDALAPCCVSLEFSVEDCKSLFEFAAAGAAAAREELFVFHQDRADLCLADLRAEGICSGIEPASCRSVTEGTLAGGEVCRDAAECVSSARSGGACLPDADGTDRCQFPGRAAERGEACVGSCADLFPCSSDEAGMDGYCYEDTGLFCNGDGVCQDFVALGAPCGVFDECASGAACRGGLCVAKAGVGASCTQNAQCTDENHCSSGVCSARQPVGAACDDASDSCLNGFCTEGRCTDVVVETLCGFGAF